MLSLKKNKLLFLLTFLFWIVLILKIAESFVFKGHGDAVSYHLVLGRYILEYGIQYAHKSFYLSSLTGVFDYLYIIPQWFFDSKIAAHLSSQFIHLLFSTLSMILIFKAIFKDNRLFLLGSLSLLTFARSPDYFIYAKNDGFLALSFFCGVLVVYHDFPFFKEKCLKYRPIIIGITVGLLPVIKMSGLIYSVVLFFGFVWEERRNINQVIKALPFCIGVSSFIFIRNWIVIGNPLFPSFLSLFPTEITPEMGIFMDSMLKTSTGFRGILQNYLVAFTPKALAILCIPLFWNNRRVGKGKLNKLIFLILGFTTLYCLINSGYPAERFYFGCHFVLIYFIFKGLDNFSLFKSKKILFFLLLLILADSKIDKMAKRSFYFYRDVYKMGLSNKLLHKHAPYTQFWSFVNEGEKVISDDARMTFYAPKGVRLYHSGLSREANYLWRCKPGEEFGYKDFDVAFLSELRPNRCTELIKANSDKIMSTLAWTMYRIRK